MQRLLLILLLCAISHAKPGLAQVACSGQGIPLSVIGGAPFVGLTPAAPNASQALTFSAGMLDFNPISASAIVNAGVIDLTLTGNYIGLTTPPPITCSLATIGPLPADTYVLNLYNVDPSSKDPTPVLVATGAITIGSTAASVPTLSPFGLLVLATLIALCGLTLRSSGRARTRRAIGA